MADPFLLLILGEGQEKHVPGRGHIVVYCWRMANRDLNIINVTSRYLKDDTLNIKMDVTDRLYPLLPHHTLVFRLDP